MKTHSKLPVMMTNGVLIIVSTIGIGVHFHSWAVALGYFLIVAYLYECWCSLQDLGAQEIPGKEGKVERKVSE